MRPGTRSGISWRWPYALRGLVTVTPAAAATLSDVQLGAVLAVGLMPVCSLPLPARRVERARLGLYGVLSAASIFLGGVLAQWPVAAVVGLVLAGGGLGHAVVRLRRPVAMLGLMLCLPLFAVGFSYPGTETVGEFAGDILLGTAWAVLVALLWPTPGATSAPREEDVPTAGPGIPPAGVMIPYGWTAGLVGGACAAIGFAADLEHVGWAPAAALLVMRPSPPAQQLRSVDRLADVALGAAVAVGLVVIDPPTWVFAVAIALVGIGATATAGSSWYVLPTFTTFLVFILLLVGTTGDARERFWERVLETALGIGVAAVATALLLAVRGHHERRDEASVPR